MKLARGHGDTGTRGSDWQSMCQQANFRLLKPIAANDLTVSLVLVRSRGPFEAIPDYGLIDVKL